MNDWYEEMDYERNPFNRRTRAFGAEGVLDEVFYAIVSGNMIVLEGGEGMGKTKVLREAIKKFRRSGRVIYLNTSELDKNLNIEKAIKGKRNFFDRLFNLKPRNMVLLLDDVESLSPRNSERIKYYYDQNYIRSVVFSTKNFGSLSLSQSLIHRISRIIKIRPLGEYEAVQLVRAKIGNNMITDRVVKSVYRMSEGNTQRFLKNCERVCRAAAKNQPLNEDTIKEIIK